MQAMQQMWRRLQLLAAQGVATLVGPDVVQTKVLDGELIKAKRVEPYGLSYRPKPGAQAYVIFPGGDRALGLALVIGDKQYQMELAEGEVALHDDEGNFVKLGRGGAVTVKASASITLDAPVVTVTGVLNAQQAVNVSGALTANGGAEVQGSLQNNGVNVGSEHAHAGVRRGGESTDGPH